MWGFLRYSWVCSYEFSFIRDFGDRSHVSNVRCGCVPGEAVHERECVFVPASFIFHLSYVCHRLRRVFTRLATCLGFFAVFLLLSLFVFAVVSSMLV